MWTFVVNLSVVVIVSCNALPFQIRDPSRDPIMEQPVDTFKRTDTDQNGSLTFDEFLHTDLPYEQLKREEFEILDANHDGTISRQEYETHYLKEKQNADDLRAEYFGQIYEEFDLNFDLKLSKDEVEKVLEKRFMLKPRANFAKIFRSFDKNNDDGLDLDEYLAFDAQLPFHEMEPVVNTVTIDDVGEETQTHTQMVPEKPILAFKTEKLPMMKQKLVLDRL